MVPTAGCGMDMLEVQVIMRVGCLFYQQFVSGCVIILVLYVIFNNIVGFVE